MVHASPVGAHVGLLYRPREGAGHQVLHQAWHWDTRAESAEDYQVDYGEGVWWVRPGMDPFELADLRTHAALVAQRLTEQGVPYAFEIRDAVIASDGRICLNGSRGLTCATFLQLVFDAARVRLVEEATWAQRSESRKAEDRQARSTLVGYLEKSGNPGAREHARSLASEELDGVRVRAEELAAASAQDGRPVDYVTAEVLGRAVLDAMR